MATKQFTQKKEDFCLAYIETGIASEAYRRVYDTSRMKPETIHKRASELLGDREVKGRIAELREKVQESAIATVEQKREWLVQIVKKSMKQTEITDETGEGTGEYIPDGPTVIKAIHELNKMDGDHASIKNDHTIKGNLGVQWEVEFVNATADT